MLVTSSHEFWLPRSPSGRVIVPAPFNACGLWPAYCCDRDSNQRQTWVGRAAVAGTSTARWAGGCLLAGIPAPVLATHRTMLPLHVNPSRRFNFRLPLHDATCNRWLLNSSHVRMQIKIRINRSR